jgi:hypothetical protein
MNIYEANKVLKQTAKELEKLGDFILQEFPHEPGRHGDNEGAVDVALRLLRQYKDLTRNSTRPAGV